jgi:hypothetical protein
VRAPCQSRPTRPAQEADDIAGSSPLAGPLQSSLTMPKRESDSGSRRDQHPEPQVAPDRDLREYEDQQAHCPEDRGDGTDRETPCAAQVSGRTLLEQRAPLRGLSVSPVIAAAGAEMPKTSSAPSSWAAQLRELALALLVAGVPDAAPQRRILSIRSSTSPTVIGGTRWSGRSIRDS